MEATYTERREPSKGLDFATGMLIFMLAELGVIAGIDPERWTDSHSILLTGTIVLIVIQAVGMFLTYCGRYKLGGSLQIVASAVHLIDLMGILGIMGGMRSRKYPEKMQALDE